VRAFVKPYIPFTWLYYDQILRDAGDIACLLEIGWEHLPEGMRIFS
ncbi:MAG: hypothetical protein HYV36_03970, partial [Lentisphaerae bacterium]|nr:hypothetical protein [Lentisphaerota bacterium]